MGDQDWTPVTVTKTAKQRTAGMSSAQAISQVNNMRHLDPLDRHVVLRKNSEKFSRRNTCSESYDFADVSKI